MFLYCKFFIVDNFNVKKRLKFKLYLYICTINIKKIKEKSDINSIWKTGQQ